MHAPLGTQPMPWTAWTNGVAAMKNVSLFVQLLEISIFMTFVTEFREIVGERRFSVQLATQRATHNSTHNSQLSVQLMVQCNTLLGLVVHLCRLMLWRATWVSVCNLGFGALLGFQCATWVWLPKISNSRGSCTINTEQALALLSCHCRARHRCISQLHPSKKESSRKTNCRRRKAFD